MYLNMQKWKIYHNLYVCLHTLTPLFRGRSYRVCLHTKLRTVIRCATKHKNGAKFKVDSRNIKVKLGTFMTLNIIYIVRDRDKMSEGYFIEGPLLFHLHKKSI